MFLFRRPPNPVIPKKAQEFRKETHRAAIQATESIGKLNEVMSNGITFKIYLATGGKHKV